MKLERRKFKYQSYYNSIQGYPVPCECVLEYIEPLEAEALELAVERATANMVAAQNRVAELEKALTDKIEERPVHKSSFDYEAEGKV
jgi:hypothetical protein